MRFVSFPKLRPFDGDSAHAISARGNFIAPPMGVRHFVGTLPRSRCGRGILTGRGHDVAPQRVKSFAGIAVDQRAEPGQQS